MSGETAPRRRFSILIVEDDRDMTAALARNLERDGYTVLQAADGERGIELARAARPDAIVLDLMLPRLNGYRVLRTLRAEGILAPVLMLTARSAEADKILGFRLGADDYVTKPFSLQELLARVAALLRRVPRQEEADEVCTSFGAVSIDLAARTVHRNGAPVSLTPRAYELLLALCRRPGMTVSRRDLLRDVWGYGDGVDSRTLDAHVAELRKKLEPNPGTPTHIITAWRVGYRFEKGSR
jgi:DNA-binding response OmpR family regulator